MKRVLYSVLWGAVVAASIAIAPSFARGDDDGRPKPPLDASGSYSIKVAGFAKGLGQASSTGDRISITASITDENGNKGDLTADLPLDKKNHFTGTGTVMGQSVKFNGRLDPATQDETAIKTNRLVCTFTTSDGQYGRIAGYVPDPTGGAAIHKHGGKKDDAGAKNDSKGK